jgi:hypothetical protein
VDADHGRTHTHPTSCGHLGTSWKLVANGDCMDDGVSAISNVISAVHDDGSTVYAASTARSACCSNATVDGRLMQDSVDGFLSLWLG